MKSEKSGSRMKSNPKAEILMIRLWIEKEAECIYKLQSLKRLEERIRKNGPFFEIKKEDGNTLHSQAEMTDYAKLRETSRIC